MRSLILSYFLVIGVFSNAQSSWNTSTRVGYNRIGLGFDQTIGYSFGNKKEHTIALGAKWYWIDVVFAKETVGLTFDYRFNFRADEMPMQFSLGFNCNGFWERFNNTGSRIADLSIYNRGTLQIGGRLEPFYEIGAGIVVHNSTTTAQNHKSSYFNYNVSIGLNIKLGSTNE